MKRVISFILAAILLIISSLTAIGAETNEQHVVDMADVFTDEEISQLEAEMRSIYSAYDFDTLIVTTKDSRGQSAQSYAADFYDDFRSESDYPDGLIFSFNFDLGEYYEVSRGTGIRLFSDQGEEALDNLLRSHLALRDWAGAMSAYLMDIDSTLAKDRKARGGGLGDIEVVEEVYEGAEDMLPATGEDAVAAIESASVQEVPIAIEEMEAGEGVEAVGEGTEAMSELAAPVQLPNTKAEQAVRLAAGLGDGEAVTDVALASIETLDLSDCEMNDLSFLRYATGLKSLILESNGISDLRPLSELRSLRFLSLDDNMISDLSLLSGLLSLETLSLYDNLVSDLAPLSALNSLKTLSLGDNLIADLKPLSGLVSLQTLGLNDNQITDISSLGALSSLQVLWLQNNQLGNASGLEVLLSMSELKTLYLSGNRINVYPQELENIEEKDF